MKTQKQSFEELRSRANQPSEYLTDERCVYTLQDSVWLGLPSKENAISIAIQPNYKRPLNREESASHTELITRLLNAFVARDGMQVLMDAMEFIDSVNPSSVADYVEQNNAVSQLRALIAQLDGHANTD